jgi:hypothetical protein
MVGSRVNARGRQARVEIGCSIAEQLQRGFYDRRRCGAASRRRRLQRRRDEAPAVLAFHRDRRVVELQYEHPVAEASGQCGSQRNGRVTAERHLRFG